MESDGLDRPATCPSCGAGLPALIAAGQYPGHRVVCERCGECWNTSNWSRVDTLRCPGCRRRSICESRPTWLAGSLTHTHTVLDGSRLLVRPLLYQDRDELAGRYLGLSPLSKRLRFFSPPERLSRDDLEYLTNLDYRQHFAWAAFAVDEQGSPGVGVARYVVLPEEPGCAEAAVTVIDDFQGRGIGTLLLEHLVGTATANGVSTLVTYVLWENAPAVEALREVPARVRSAEPGVARLDLDIGEPEQPLPDGFAGRLLRLLATIQGATLAVQGANHTSSPAAAPGSSR